MRRWIAIAWHASFLVLAAALYFFFVLPRWFELTGAWPVGLGQPMRIVDGVLIGLAALPIVFTYLHTRKPEFGTPQLALLLRLWAIVLHVVAGVLIVGTAVAEFWVSLESGGRWLFGIYGAAAAIALLGAVAFYLAYIAELPPPAPKPLRVKDPVNRRQRRKSAEDATDEDAADVEDVDATEAVPLGVLETPPSTSPTESEADADPDISGETTAVVQTSVDDEPVADAADESELDAADSDAESGAAATPTDDADPADEAEDAAGPASDADSENAGKLRNRRPSGKSGSSGKSEKSEKSRLFRRSRGGNVALDE